MKEKELKRIVLAGVSSSSGKTTVACGLMRLLHRKNYRVAPYKVGPDYIDPSFHEKACGSTSKNLDEFMLSLEEIRYLFAKSQEDFDIHIIEGVMGLYDGYGYRYDYCSTASMAKLLDTSVILILDAKSMAASAAATVLGYRELDREVRISGVILNNVSSESHYAILKKAIETYTDLPVLGRIPKNPLFSLPSRHLGLIPSCEIDELDSQLNLVADVLEEHIDIERLLDIATSPLLPLESDGRESIRKITDIKIAVAQDNAFHFYYRDSLELLEEMGVEFVTFSPLHDEVLPECDAVFLGGGFPEIFAEKLSKNHSMRESIRTFGETGGVIYAECGGLMYLGTSLLDKERRKYPMVGLLEGKSLMTDRLQRFGYCQGTALEDTVISKKGQVIRGHEFHYSNFETGLSPVYKMEKYQDGRLLRSWEGGYVYKNVLGTYLHLHFCGDHEVARAWIEYIERSKEKKHQWK